MPELPIKFTKGLSRLSGAPLDSLYDLQNARITPIDEVVAWKRGTTLTDKWLPRAKPWAKFNGRWFDANYMDDSFQYRNRLYLSKTNGVDVWTTQIVEDTSDLDAVYGNIPNNFLGQIGIGFALQNNIGFLTNLFQTQEINVAASDIFSWTATDEGIRGITLGRAVDYIMVPVDRFGQSGPWRYHTVFMDLDPAGATDISGTAVFTGVPTFDFPQIRGIFSGDETSYEKVFVYRTIEYDLEGFTTDPASGTGAEPLFGGYYFEGVANDTYKSTAYWPFDIDSAVSTLSDQLGPVIDRNRNHWRYVLSDPDIARNIGAKVTHMDGGTAIYANVSAPTKDPQTSMYLPGNSYGPSSVTFATGPNTMTLSAGTWAGAIVGDVIYVRGATDAANNGQFNVTGVAGAVLTVSETLTAEGPTANINAMIGAEVAFLNVYINEDGSKAYNNRSYDYDVYTATLSRSNVMPWQGEDGLDVFVKITADIVSITAATDTIVIKGDWTEFLGRFSFGDQDSFNVSGTASNDGNFTIQTGADAGSTVQDVRFWEGGTMTFDSVANTITRSIGSWITDGYGIGQNFDFGGWTSEQNGLYSISAVTATTVTVNEDILYDSVEQLYYIAATDAVASGGNTVIVVNEDITVTEGAVGEVSFYVLWESLKVDQNGRYRSSKQANGKQYAFNARSPDYNLWSTDDYDDGLTYAALPTGVEAIRRKSAAYLSEVNAPWTVTYDGFTIPDSSEILAIVPSRAEEIEQLISHSFYVFTDNRVYVGQRSGREVSLTVVESSTGIALGNNNQPLVVPVKSGVVFYGTDSTLYYLSGRRLEKLSYQVLSGNDKLWDNGVDDLGYDPSQDFLYVLTADNVVADSDVYMYDFELKRWMGAYDVFQPILNYNTQIHIADTLDGTEIVNDQFGASFIFSDDLTFTQADFTFCHEEMLGAYGIAFNVLVDRVSPPGTDTIAVVTQPDSGYGAWTVASGDVLSGDVVVDNGDTLRLTFNAIASINAGGGSGRIFMDGITGPGQIDQRVKGIGYDYDIQLPIFGYETVGGTEAIVVEKMDDTGASIIDAQVVTQEISTALTTEIVAMKFDYDGIEYTSTADYTVGSDQLTNLDTGTIFSTSRDPLATIKIDDAGHNQAGLDIDLVTFIASVSGSVATLVDEASNSGTGKTIVWRTSGDLTINVLSDSYRDRQIGKIRVRPNKPIYPKGTKGHRIRIKFEDFETLREILIFTENQLESD